MLQIIIAFIVTGIEKDPVLLQNVKFGGFFQARY